MGELEQRVQRFLQWYEKNEPLYKDFANHILGKIQEALRERDILYAYKSARVKTLTSLKEKCSKKKYVEKDNIYVPKYDDPRNQITDLAGVRIVCYLPQDIPPVRHIIESMFDVDSENSMNKADLLNENEVGYLSVHYIVSLKEEQLSTELRKFKNMKCEIQLRTVLQDAWSQVFHDRQYKNNTGSTDISGELLRETNLVAGALELLDNEIGRLVKRYDDLAEGINNIVYQELLDYEISKENVEKYFMIKFAGLGVRFYDYENMSIVMNKYGLVTIRDIDTMLDDGLVQDICKLHVQSTIDKILMYGMIVYNYDTFFSIEENAEVVLSGDAHKLLTNFVNIDEACEKYNIEIRE